MTAETLHITAPERATIHPAWVRVCHWINALAILVMIGSGWQIYNASPLFGFAFPGAITIGGWLAGALLWHFAAMWVLVINGLVYVTLGIVTGRFRRKLLPIHPRDVIADVKAALTTFDLTDVRLRLPETPGDVHLNHASCLAGGPQERSKDGTFALVNGLPHDCPRALSRTYGLVPNIPFWDILEPAPTSRSSCPPKSSLERNASFLTWHARSYARTWKTSY